MVERNRFGLSRTIGNAVKREVRQRCGYGCVRCGLALYDYEHFAPDFKDATEHRAAGITLLCMQCNQKRRRGMLSVETVAAANEAPFCKAQGFANEMFDFGTEPLEILFSGLTFTNIETLIRVNDFPLFSVLPPEHSHQPYRVFGRFADETGEITLTVDDNEWRAGSDNWDVECVGPRITIRNGPGRICLVLRSDPPHRLVIERLNMQFEGVAFICDNDLLRVSMNGGRSWMSWKGSSVRNGKTGLSLRNR